MFGRFSRFIGKLLVLIGLLIIILCLLPITTTDEVVNISFTLAPGEKYGSYDDGAVYHYRVFFTKFRLLSNSVLVGEVLVYMDGIYLNINGLNTDVLKNIYVKDRLVFASTQQ